MSSEIREDEPLKYEVRSSEIVRTYSRVRKKELGKDATAVSGDSKLEKIPSNDAPTVSGFESIWLQGTPASVPLAVKVEPSGGDEDNPDTTTKSETLRPIGTNEIKLEPEDSPPDENQVWDKSEPVANIKEEIDIEFHTIQEVKVELPECENGNSFEPDNNAPGETPVALFGDYDDVDSELQEDEPEKTEATKLCLTCDADPYSCSASSESSFPKPVRVYSRSTSLSRPKSVDNSCKSPKSESTTSPMGNVPKTNNNSKPTDKCLPKSSVGNSVKKGEDFGTPNIQGKEVHPRPSREVESDFLISLAEYLFHQQMTDQLVTSIKHRLRKLKRKCQESGKTSLNEICIMDFDPEVRSLAKDFSSMRFNMLKRKVRRPANRYAWTVEEKTEYLCLFHRSPRSYMVLNMIFGMPKRKCLNALINSLIFQPGFNPNVLKCLEIAMKDMQPIDSLCCLTFDVMAIEPHLTYNQTRGNIVGFEDFGEERNSDPARGALVFMLCGLNRNWKIPIAYFMCHNISVSKLKELISQVLDSCFKAGAQIVALVCDMAAYNVEALKLMGASFTNPYFSFRDHTIATVYDTSHLLKYTRNLLRRCHFKMTTSGGETRTASWDHVLKLHSLDRDSSERLAPKLTKAHISPVGKSKLQVKIAVETLSHTVAEAVSTLVSRGQLDTVARPTAELIEELDCLFDSLIGEVLEPIDGKLYRCAVTKDSPHTKLWSQASEHIKHWQFVDVKTGKVVHSPCKGGWLATLQAIDLVWGELQERGLSHLKPRTLSLDPLQNMFGTIRYLYRRKLVTPFQFMNGLKIAIIKGLPYGSSQSSYCEADSACLINELQKQFLDYMGPDPSPLPVVGGF